MIEFLFIDLDDTILDFQKAEYVALQQTLRQFGIEPTETVCARYSQINKAHWEALERRELTRQQVMVGRYATLFEELGISADALEDLALRYITMRLKNGEIRQNYYFFAQAKHLPQGLESREGILSWHSLDEIDDLPMPVSAKHVLLHYRSQGRFDKLLRGGMTTEDETSFIPLTEF